MYVFGNARWYGSCTIVSVSLPASRLPSLERRVGPVASLLPSKSNSSPVEEGSAHLTRQGCVVSAPFDSIDDQTSFIFIFFPGSWEGRSVRLPVLIGGARQKGNEYLLGRWGMRGS